MRRLMVTVVFAAISFSASASADEVFDSLKVQAIGACKLDLGGGAGADVDKMCGCIVDNIVTMFGGDATTMLKILKAGFSFSDTAEIASLMGVSEAEAKSFAEAAGEKMGKVQEACMPTNGAK